MCNAFYCRVQKSIFNNTEFAIFGDEYLSQDLINVILRNITQLCQVRQRGPYRDRLQYTTKLSRGIDPKLF